jgi:hypothetical protein
MAATNNKVNSSEILRSIMKDQHRTYEYLREKLDYKTVSGISSRVLGDDMKLSTMVQILETLGYRLVVEPANGKLSRAGCYEVEEEAESEAGEQK